MARFFFIPCLLSIFFIHAGYGQSPEMVNASLQYQIKFTHQAKVLIDDRCQLDIGENESYFYSLGEVENIRRIAEKYKKAQAAGTTLHLDSKEMLHDLCEFTVLKEYVNKKAIVIQYIGGQYLGFVRDTLRTKRWKILKEVQKINSLICRKAVMKKDTTEITAWFCPDIPFQEGPISYYGLPGLIVKASSTAGFEASLISITYNKDPKKVIMIEPYALVSEKQFIRAAGNANAAFKSGHLPNGDEAKQISGDH